MKTYFRLILIFAIILLTSIMTALTCDKENGANQSITNEGNVTNVTNETNIINVVNETNFTNNTNKTNVTKNTSRLNKTEIVSKAVEGGSPIPRIPVARGLENFVITVNSAYAKLEGGAIYINATKLANDLGPAISDLDGDDRGVGKLADLVDDGDPGAVNVPRIFTISIKDATGGIMLLQPVSVTRNTLEYAATTATGYPAALNTAPVATTIYRTYNFWTGTGPYVWNTFGDFRHTDPTEAQGVFYCRAYLSILGVANINGPLTGGETMECRFASINNAVRQNAEVDEAWVDSAATTKILELRLFGIDTGAKTIPNIGGGRTGLNYGNLLSNAIMQQIMDTNTYYESKLTVKIVKEGDF